MDLGPVTERSAWKRRVEEFERNWRPPLEVVLAFAGLYFLFFAVVLSCTDMDGHDRIEEPIRNFVYQSLRSLLLVVFVEPAKRLPAPIGGLVTYSAFLGSALGFGFLATWLLRSFRRANRTG